MADVLEMKPRSHKKKKRSHAKRSHHAKRRPSTRRKSKWEKANPGLDFACFKKAIKRGDSTFTLVGQDFTSPAVICEWIKANVNSAPDKKLHEALRKAIAMTKIKHRRWAD